MRPRVIPPLADEPLVSALVTNRNYGRFVDKAISSVLTQSWANVEVVVCDNGSTDDSVERVERWCRSDPRVTLVRQPDPRPSVGASVAFRHSNGAIVALLDSDDWWTSTKAERIVSAFRASPDVGFVVHAVIMTDESGRPIARPRPPRFPRDGWLPPVFARGWYGDMGVTSSMAARREVAVDVFDLPSGPDPARFDRVFAERCAVIARVETIDEALAFYRIHKRSLLADIRAADGAAQTNRVLEFREAIAAGRAEYIETVHGVHVDAGRLVALLRAEPELRLAMTMGTRPTWSEIRVRARSPMRAVGWMVLTRAPSKPARKLLMVARIARDAVKRRDWRLRVIRARRAGRRA